MRHLLKTIFAAALVAAFLLPACASFFGEAETPEQKAFKVGAQYVYVATPAANYLALPGAEPGTVAAVCNLDKATYDGFQAARAAIEAGGDRLTVALAGAASALADFSLEVIGDVGVPDTSDIAAKTIIWARVGLVSAASMRAWRKGFLKPKLAAMVAENREPTETELAQVDDKATALHQAIQARCSL